MNLFVAYSEGRRLDQAIQAFSRQGRAIRFLSENACELTTIESHNYELSAGGEPGDTGPDPFNFYMERLIFPRSRNTEPYDRWLEQIFTPSNLGVLPAWYEFLREHEILLRHRLNDRVFRETFAERAEIIQRAYERSGFNLLEFQHPSIWDVAGLNEAEALFSHPFVSPTGVAELLFGTEMLEAAYLYLPDRDYNGPRRPALSPSVRSAFIENLTDPVLRQTGGIAAEALSLFRDIDEFQYFVTQR